MTDLLIASGSPTTEVNPASKNPIRGSYNPAANPIGADNGQPNPATSKARAKQLWIDRYGLYDLGDGWHGHPELGDETLQQRGGAALQFAADHRNEPLPAGLSSWLPPCPGAAWSGTGALSDIALFDAAFCGGSAFVSWVDQVQSVIARQPGQNTPIMPTHGQPAPIDGIPASLLKNAHDKTLHGLPLWGDPNIRLDGWADFVKAHVLDELDAVTGVDGYDDFNLSDPSKSVRFLVPGSLAVAVFLAWDAAGRPQKRADIHAVPTSTVAPPATSPSDAEALLAVLDEVEGESLAMSEPDMEALLKAHTPSQILQGIELGAFKAIFPGLIAAVKQHFADSIAAKLGS